MENRFVVDFVILGKLRIMKQEPRDLKLEPNEDSTSRELETCFI